MSALAGKADILGEAPTRHCEKTWAIVSTAVLAQKTP
jgi:hypothetical protein